MAARLDILFFARRNKRLTDENFRDIETSHLMISCALVIGWITGFTLLYMLTGFEISAFSPKLWAKLFVVSTLSLNALLIAHYVLPVLRENQGSTVLEIPTRKKIPMALSAATSAMCWMTALALGACGFFKTQTKEFLVTMLSIELAIGVLVAVCVAVLIKPKDKAATRAEPRFTSRRDDHARPANPSKRLRETTVSNA